MKKPKKKPKKGRRKKTLKHVALTGDIFGKDF